jgi:hypothetical protein
MGKPPMEFEDVRKNLLRACVGGLAEAEYDPSSIECRRCDTRPLCKPEAVVVNGEDMGRILEDYYIAHKAEKEAEVKKDAAKELILQYSDNSGLSRFKAEKWVASISRFPRETVSLKALLALGIKREDIEDAIKESKIARISVIDLEDM